MSHPKKNPSSSGSNYRQTTNKNDHGGRRKTSTRRVLVPIADGTEEIELTCITDVLSRFGAEVVTAAVEEAGWGTSLPPPDGGSSFTGAGAGAGQGGRRERVSGGDGGGVVDAAKLVCRMSRGLKVVADTTIQSAAEQEWDLIALPGGINGSRNLRSSEHLMSLLQRHSRAQRLCGAICAAPAIVLASAPVLGSGSSLRGATCYPAKVLRTSIPDASDDDVVVRGKVVTSQGPGTALKFALQLGEELFGRDKADKIARKLLVDRYGRFEKASAGGDAEPRLPLPRGLGDSDEDSDADSEAGGSGTRKRKRDDSDGEGMAGSCFVGAEAKAFREVVWPTLDRFGWTMERGSKRGDVYYCQPGVKRKKGIADEASRGVHFFDNRRDALKCLAKEWAWNTEVQQALQTFTACLERMTDLIAMGRLSPDDCTVASLTAEVAKNANIAEVPLFDRIVLPQLEKLGWIVEEATRTRKKAYLKTSYVTRDSKRFVEGTDYFVSRQQVLDFLCYDDTWGSMDEVLRCRDVYQACIAVGNELSKRGKLQDNYSVEWLIEKAREKRPALPIVPGVHPEEWLAEKEKEKERRPVRPAAATFAPNLTQENGVTSNSQEGDANSRGEVRGVDEDNSTMLESGETAAAKETAEPTKSFSPTGEPTKKRKAGDGEKAGGKEETGKLCPAVKDGNPDGETTAGRNTRRGEEQDVAAGGSVEIAAVVAAAAAADDDSATARAADAAPTAQPSNGFYQGQRRLVLDTVGKWLEATVVAIATPQDVLENGAARPAASSQHSPYGRENNPRRHRRGRRSREGGGGRIGGIGGGSGGAVSADDLEGRRSLLLEADDDHRVVDKSKTSAAGENLELLLIHYNGYSHSWDEWIRSDSVRIRTWPVAGPGRGCSREKEEQGKEKETAKLTAKLTKEVEVAPKEEGTTTAEPNRSCSPTEELAKKEEAKNEKEKGGKARSNVSTYISPDKVDTKQMVSAINGLLDNEEEKEDTALTSSPTGKQSSGKRKNGKSKPPGPKVLRDKPAPEIGPGWSIRIVERQSGKYAGQQDNYWFSPAAKKKFRSMKEVERFKKVLEGVAGVGCGEGDYGGEGDEYGREREEEAWKLLKKGG